MLLDGAGEKTAHNDKTIEVVEINISCSKYKTIEVAEINISCSKDSTIEVVEISKDFLIFLIK